MPPRRSITMQHNLFTHQGQYHPQPDWHHNPPAQHYGQSHAAAAANAAAQQQQQQQHYGRAMSAAGQNNGANSNGNGVNNMGNMGGGNALGGAGGEHGGSIMGPGDSISEENRRVLDWIAQVLRADTREAALLELSKKREQVPELALILWHSFGKCLHTSQIEIAMRPLSSSYTD